MRICSLSNSVTFLGSLPGNKVGHFSKCFKLDSQREFAVLILGERFGLEPHQMKEAYGMTTLELC